MVQIRLSHFLEERIGGVSCVHVSADTVRGALETLTDRHPQLARSIWIRDGVVNPIMAVFLNDELIGPDKLETPVKSGDQMVVVAAVAGGR